MLYCLSNPEGKFVEATIATSRDDCWIKSFESIMAENPEFGSKYWKKWNESQRAAKKLGYNICKVSVIPR